MVALDIGDLTPVEITAVGEVIDDTETKLHEIEELLRSTIHEVEKRSWQAAFHIYHIHMSEMWKSGKDAEGKNYINFETYIKDLRERIPRMAVRWAQEMISVISLCIDVLGLSFDDIAKCSPSSLREIRKLAEYDPRVKDKVAFRIDGGATAVADMVKDAGEETTRYTDIKSRVETALAKPRVSWSIARNPDSDLGEFDLVGYYDDLPYEFGVTPRSDAPKQVLDDMRKRLGVAQ